MATAKLRPFRQIDENDVVNLFAFDGVDVDAGAIVKLETSSAKSWSVDSNFSTDSINNNYGNTVSDRYGVTARVSLADSGEAVLGMLLFGVKEVDENGEKLIWHPRKAHEMQVSLSGQAVPVVTRGIVLVNGITATLQPNSEAIAPGVRLFAGDNGAIMTHADVDGGIFNAGTVWKDGYLGYCLGKDDGNGNVLIKLEPGRLGH